MKSSTLWSEQSDLEWSNSIAVLEIILEISWNRLGEM